MAQHLKAMDPPALQWEMRKKQKKIPNNNIQMKIEKKKFNSKKATKEKKAGTQP